MSRSDRSKLNPATAAMNLTAVSSKSGAVESVDDSTPIKESTLENSITNTIYQIVPGQTWSGQTPTTRQTTDKPKPASLLSSSPIGANQKLPKKSSFQITRVITKGNEPGGPDDVTDELDETNTNTEDFQDSDISRLTDGDPEPLSADAIHTPVDEPWSMKPVIMKPANNYPDDAIKHSDMHSRFKIVQIESKENFKRGRWTCHDFFDPLVKAGETGGDSLNTSNSIYYLPGTEDPSKSPYAPAIVYNEGHPQLEASFLKSPLYNVTSDSRQHAFQFYRSTPFLDMDQQQQSNTVRPFQAVSQPAGRADVSRLTGRDNIVMDFNRLSDSMATMNPSSANLERLDSESSGSSIVAIDNKIEQAMDLVKSHLMFAVREEVEVLKEQIKDLVDKNTLLEHENRILRAHATP